MYTRTKVLHEDAGQTACEGESVNDQGSGHAELPPERSKTTHRQRAAGGWLGEQESTTANLTHAAARATESRVSFAASKAGRQQVTVPEVKQPGHPDLSKGTKAVRGADGTGRFCLRRGEVLHKLFCSGGRVNRLKGQVMSLKYANGAELAQAITFPLPGTSD